VETLLTFDSKISAMRERALGSRFEHATGTVHSRISASLERCTQK